MLSHSTDLKIFNSVVRLDFIEVMNVLVSSKLSANVLRHDNTMLKLVVISDSDRNVAIRSHKSSSVLVFSSAIH